MPSLTDTRRDYTGFLHAKTQWDNASGFTATYMPDFLFGFQYDAVRLGRVGIGVELKPSYYRQAVKNLESAADETPAEALFNLDDTATIED